MSCVLGIDPGLSGAIALYDPVGGTLRVWDMATSYVVRNGKKKREVSPAGVAHVLAELEIYRGPGDLVALVEKVGSMPGQGVTSMFSFGRSVGVVEGALAVAGVPYSRILPTQWRKIAGVVGGKDGSRARAVELFPKQAGLFARAKDDGRAEAALIAYCAHKMKVN